MTGASLWPTGASWNPTCSMVALAMHLADTLEPNKAIYDYGGGGGCKALNFFN